MEGSGAAGEWVHEDSLDLRVIKAFRRTLLDEDNAERAHAALRRKTVRACVVGLFDGVLEILN